MKSSKTLIILLVIPFAIALLSFISVIVLNNTVAADISDIIWDYDENEGFQISNEPYKLKAEAVVDESLVLAPGNDLTWTLKNIDNSENEYAKIEQSGNDYYLYAISEGECKITCSNIRGTKSKSFNASIFKDGKIIINDKIARSGANVDPIIYYGQYDLSYNSLKLDGCTKVESKIELVPEVFGSSGQAFAKALTNNVTVDNNVVTIKGSGIAEIEFYTNTAPYLSTVHKMHIVENGVNVYSYNDLLMCTNFSSEGEIVIMQTNLESLKNTYVFESGVYKNQYLEGKDHNKLFGNFDFVTQRFNFDNEITSIKSTYNTKFIHQYNEQKGTNYEDKISVGLHVKKDIYGNGFTINAHGLAYPNYGTYNEAGKLTPTKGLDYFFGPLAYVTIGDLVNMPVVKAYGQDNALIYLDGDDLLVNDINIRNTNEIDNMYNLLFAGSVIDVNGNNNTIKNSIVSNGRNIVRAYSADGLIIDNCILKNAAQFILSIGSNEYNVYDTNKNVSAYFEGKTYSSNFVSFFDTTNKKEGALAIIDPIMESGAVTNATTLNNYLSSLNDIQNGLDNVKNYYDDNDEVIYNDEIYVSRTSFYNSGIFSIAFESMFNGPFLYNGMVPSSIENLISTFGAVMPTAIGGTSSPVRLNLDSSSSFYDWKDIDTIDTSILIEENISTMIKILAGKDIPLSMEDFYPLVSMLEEQLNKHDYVYLKDGKKYVNTKIAWYGGGKNMSNVRISQEDFEQMDLSTPVNVDVTSSILQGKYISNIHNMVLLLSKCVSLATGFHSFNFITNNVINGVPEDFDKVPQIEDLKNNLK